MLVARFLSKHKEDPQNKRSQSLAYREMVRVGRRPVGFIEFAAGKDLFLFNAVARMRRQLWRVFLSWWILQ
jgi:hypothetical protein